VVDRHEVDLGLPVRRIAQKAIVGLDQGAVEDLLEGSPRTSRDRATWAVIELGSAITSSWKRA
jgi:hypothetical protein